MLRWGSSTRDEGGVEERRFEVTRDGGGPIPGVVWLPPGAPQPGPLVLLGHGGAQHKAHARMLARRDALDGIATAAIDGPVHGDRGGVSSMADPRLAAAFASMSTYDSIVADWQAALDALVAERIADPERIGY